MNTVMLRLELRKNALAAAALVAAFLVTLPVGRLVSAATGLDAHKAYEAVVLAWLTVGLAFCACLLGAASGSQASSRDVRDTEALLPVSPRARALSSLLSALLLLAAVTLFFVGVAAFTDAGLARLHPRGAGYDWGTSEWQSIPRSPAVLFTAALTLAAAWLLAYLIGHGVAGGLVGLLLAMTTLTGLTACYGVEIFSDRGARIDFPTRIIVIAALSLLSLVVAAVLAAAWKERRPRLSVGAAAALAACLAFGPVVSWAAAASAFRTANRQLNIHEPEASLSFQSPNERYPASPEARALAGRGVVITGAAGAAHLAGPDGLRVIAPPENFGVLDMLTRPRDVPWVRRALRDERGRVWVHRRSLGLNEFWRLDDAGKPLPARMRDPGWVDFERIGRKLYVKWWAGEKDSRYTPLEDYLALGEKAPAIIGTDTVRRRSWRELGAAEPGCAGRCLIAGKRTWRLPGRLLRDTPAAPHRLGGKTVFLVPLDTSVGVQVVIARDDGRVEAGWLADGRSTGFHVLPDSVIWDYAAGRRLAVIEADGRVGRPLPFGHLARKDGKPAAAYWPFLVRRHAGRSWVAWDGDMLVLDDRGGRVLETYPLPPNRGVRGLEDGLVIPLKDGGAAFMDWEGRMRTLKPL